MLGELRFVLKRLRSEWQRQQEIQDRIGRQGKAKHDGGVARREISLARLRNGQGQCVGPGEGTHPPTVPYRPECDKRMTARLVATKGRAARHVIPGDCD